MMKKLAVTLVLLGALAMPAPALAQSAPSSTTAPATTQTTAQRKPWTRLAIFIPVSVLAGVGIVYVRRLAADRGRLGE
jgi:hypothetical protein